jgi:hypothetical protein
MANQSRVSPIVFSPIFLLAAIVGALFSVGWLLEELWFSATAHITQGVVRGLTNPEVGHEGRRAVVQFQVGKRLVTIQSKVAWNPPPYQVGQTVRVLYPPARPERGRVSSFWEHMPAILAGIIAIVFGFVSIGTAGGEPEASQATRPRAIPLTRRAGWLLYVGAFFLGAMGLAAAGIARFIAFGGAAGVSSFFILAGLCLLLFCGYQFHRLWAQPGRAAGAGLAPGGVLAWELPRHRVERLGLIIMGLIALLWNGALACLMVELLRGALPDWAPFVIVLLILGGLLGLVLLCLLVILATVEFPAILGAKPARVEVSDQSFAPGAVGEVFVVQPGPVRLRAWQVLLVCEHQGVFQDREDAPIETRLLHQEELLPQRELVIEPGMPTFTARCSLHIPGEAPPCRTKDGMIRWKILIKGRSADWRPGFTFEYPLAVTAEETCGAAG